MSAQEIIKELMKLSPDELAEVDLKPHSKGYGSALLSFSMRT